MEERNQFTFYRSFWDAVRLIRNKQHRCTAYDVIVSYALTGAEPETEKLPDTVAMAFALARPVLDASRRKAEGGRRSRKNGKTEEGAGEDTDKISVTSGEDADNKKKNKKEGEIEGKKEREKEKESFSFSPSPDGEGSLSQAAGGKMRGSYVSLHPPTVEEVGAFCREKGYPVDPEEFTAFYASKGWKVGSAPMKDWKAAVVTWAKRAGRETVRSNGPAVSPFNGDTGDIDWMFDGKEKNGHESDL